MAARGDHPLLLGRLEEEIVRSMRLLGESEPDADRAMFVFPIGLFSATASDLAGLTEFSRDGRVILIHRPLDPAAESR